MQKEIKNWTQHFEQFSQVINDQQAILTLNKITLSNLSRISFRLVLLYLFNMSHFLFKIVRELVL